MRRWRRKRGLSEQGRPKWAIPWLENDPNLVAPQPWVGRMRYDAADALRLGCTGLLGIHWRTKILAGNIAALAAAGWERLLNRQGSTFRKLDEAQRSAICDAGAARSLMLAQPSVIKRPVVQWEDGSITVGFDATDWAMRLRR